MGIEFTHFDTHMRCLFSNPTTFALYVKMGREYNVPVKVSRNMITGFAGQPPDTSRLILLIVRSPLRPPIMKKECRIFIKMH
ncbi:MAG: hypothetical protein IPJ74_25955 [Saprospiraceae bacterium]|nr:hypothetical protein [Saprospiraceae bacterium]